MAKGCDTVAHIAAIRKRKHTVAVLPSGFNKIYPATNITLTHQIIDNGGCLISEYEPDFSATQYSFIRRDSIIAALGKATVVLKCNGPKTGTMHTVDAAIKMNRPVGFYFPENLKSSSYLEINLVFKECCFAITDLQDLSSFYDLIPESYLLI